MDALAGRLAAETDIRTLQMGQYSGYLDDPSEPAVTRHGLQPDGRFHPGDVLVDLPAGEPIGDVGYQNCVPAAMALLAQAWYAAGKEQYNPTLEDTLRIYEKVSPFRRDPAGAAVASNAAGRAANEADRSAQRPTPAQPISKHREAHNDFGTSLLLALKVWVHKDQPLAGLLPEARSFLEIEPRNLDQLREAVLRFGGVLLGLALPQSIKDAQGTLRESWYVPGYGPVYDATAGSLSSHCVAITGFSQREFFCLSAGRVRRLSPEFVLTYADEAYTVTPPAALDANPGLRDRISRDVDDIRRSDRPAGMPAFNHRWRGGNIM
ncbi:hypothetical protein ACWT_3942 [Actinoplanes sp. SE50]|uniref:hypothetical protein n=1 Tax=unclassified Actinoplanes TaxID=2626549 RepID=UPI00023ED25C|nr:MULTISPECIES: hypothetical protein [unclassified Actinoplanes]AEV84966.1 hypothetical protein ACPL_4071 [Actinoplanes sp. SE50/110]ATO83357.1 hypothetical protein ACWT_3942 [Actinoplanes sp. SE50]SLM00764.1 uncharacterized protein ACSP50_3997 [Actinoplanes sp. SE50/110]